MYFGSTIMTFALPYGAFIAAAIALYYLFRARHSGPRLRWTMGSGAQVTSVTTREPGPIPAPEVTTGVSALPVPTEPLQAPASERRFRGARSEAPPGDITADDETEGKDGEHG